MNNAFCAECPDPVVISPNSKDRGIPAGQKLYPLYKRSNSGTISDSEFFCGEEPKPFLKRTDSGHIEFSDPTGLVTSVDQTLASDGESYDLDKLQSLKDSIDQFITPPSHSAGCATQHLGADTKNSDLLEFRDVAALLFGHDGKQKLFRTLDQDRINMKLKAENESQFGKPEVSHQDLSPNPLSPVTQKLLLVAKGPSELISKKMENAGIIPKRQTRAEILSADAIDFEALLPANERKNRKIQSLQAAVTISGGVAHLALTPLAATGVTAGISLGVEALNSAAEKLKIESEKYSSLQEKNLASTGRFVVSKIIDHTQEGVTEAAPLFGGAFMLGKGIEMAVLSNTKLGPVETEALLRIEHVIISAMVEKLVEDQEKLQKLFKKGFDLLHSKPLKVSRQEALAVLSTMQCACVAHNWLESFFSKKFLPRYGEYLVFHSKNPHRGKSNESDSALKSFSARVSTAFSKLASKSKNSGSTQPSSSEKPSEFSKSIEEFFGKPLVKDLDQLHPQGQSTIDFVHGVQNQAKQSSF